MRDSKPESKTTYRAPALDEPIYPKELAPSQNDPIPAFGDEIWPMRFFSNNPSMYNSAFRWSTVPAALREYLRLAAWALFNVSIPEDLLTERSAPMAPRLGAQSIHSALTEWRAFARWMLLRGVKQFSELSEEDFVAYAEYLDKDRGLSTSTVSGHLATLTRLWMLGLQVPPLALGAIPPWVVHRVSDYLPAGDREGGGNRTDPISTATMSALLNAASQFIEVAAAPILAARGLERSVAGWDLRSRTGPRQTNGSEKLRGYLSQLRATNSPFPLKQKGAGFTYDCAFIAHAAGVTRETVYSWVRTEPGVALYAGDNSAVTSVQLVEHDLLPGSVPLADLPTYLNLLRAACFVVVSYLTGMRPGEVLALESGSMAPGSSPGGWMLIRSRTFKSVRDDDGVHDSNGRVREAPWVAIAPVIKAIRVLEEIVDRDGLLFPSSQHLKNKGRSSALYTASASVRNFIAYVNSRCVGRIPSDDGRRITPSRFRRTLAWHIANQPGGLVALAVQYGHLRTAISEGYASRMRDGIHDLVDFETARAIALNLSEISEEMDQGGGVSGPAARRLVSALREQNEQFGGVVASPQQARALLRNPNLTVYRNEEAFVWCNFNRESALCLNRKAAAEALTPRLDKCESNCSNIARTDKQAVQLRLSATRLRDEATVMPQPAAERLLAHADGLDVLAARHDEQRLVLGEMDAGNG